MAVTGTYTNRTLIGDALKKIGVVSIDEPIRAEMAEDALRALNRMLKAWQNRGYQLWTYSEQELTLTMAASYTLDPVRPVRIHGARLVRDGIETPMWEMTRQEYMDLPLKTSTGVPTQYYYDRQREAALFYIWPVLSVADGETIKISYERELEDQTDLDEVADVPGEWWEAVVYNLAARMADDYSIQDGVVGRVIGRAEDELQKALAADTEDSVFFFGPNYG